MPRWIASRPEYKWPREVLSPRKLPRRIVLWMVFHLARLAGRVLASLRPMRNSVLVIRTDGIGDGLLFEPMLRGIAQRFPESAIHLWAPAATCELFGVHAALADRRIIPRGAKPGNLEYFSSFRWHVALGWRLGGDAFDVAIYAVESPEPLGNWLFSTVRAAKKWYAPGDTENQLAWQRERTSDHATRLLHARSTGGHELLRNVYLAGQWGASAAAVPSLALSALSHRLSTSQIQYWRTLAAREGASEIVGLMAGSATAVNAYPVGSWAQVARALWQRRRAMVVLFGATADAPRVAELSQSIEGVPHTSLPPETDLMLTAALLRHLDGFITVDTGLAHLAVAADVPTVVLSNGGHPGRFFPWPVPTQSIVLSHAMPCEGCLCRCVLSEPECLTRIEPATVVAAYLHLVRPAKRAAA